MIFIRYIMIRELVETGCVKYGRFELKGGGVSRYYFDMKGLITYPKLMARIGDDIFNKIPEECTLLCGVPMGALPVCSYVSIKNNIPMIMVREQKKEYGMTRQIEGKYSKKDKCVIIEDVMTSGGSVKRVAELLRDKVDIIGVIVIMDRQEGYICDYPVKSVFCKTDIVRHMLSVLIEKKKSRLCFSADLVDKQEMLDMVDKIGSKIVVCKIHYDFYHDPNDEIKEKLVDLSVKHEFLIMEDRKFVDISYTVSKQYEKYSKWVDLVTVMGNVHSDVVSCMAGVILISNMSNGSFDATDSSLNISDKYPERVVGFVSQHRIEKEGFYTMTPGVKLVSDVDGDQQYRGKDLIDADILIVGRGIYKSEDVVKSADEFMMY